jgi:uncharacterized protein
MHTFITRPLIPALLLGWVALAGPARADVIDKGEFFSADAVKKANQRIDEVKRKHHEDLVFETYKVVPEDIRDEYLKEKKDRQALRPLFDRWLVNRAKELGVKGVYIFLCKEAEWLQIEVNNQTRKNDFTDEDRIRLRERMVTLLKNKDYDAVLSEAVDRVTTAYENHDRGKAANQHGKGNAGGGNPLGGIGGWICIGLVILLGIWVIFGLMRGMSGGGGVGGGGFFSSLLGGMFGAVAGMWMYDHFFGGGGGWGGSAMGGDGSSDGGVSGGDAGYSGDGGSYGDDGGGGGGGGDWGGGGGDWGGGGGDWGGGGDF